MPQTRPHQRKTADAKVITAQNDPGATAGAQPPALSHGTRLTLVPHLVPSNSAVAPISQEAVENGEVYTRRWVVDMILDLVEYTADRDLAQMTITDPACGTGAFLLGIVERLSAACRKQGVPLPEEAIRAFDLLDRNVHASRKSLADLLTADGWGRAEIENLVCKWIRQGDYLLEPDQPSDFVVGNPPYIRLEDVPDERMRVYRRNQQTMIGRSDIYVGFFEKALKSLPPGGVLGFICADRWMRNQYGRELRKLVSDHYSMRAAIIMHDVDAFETQVSAYPAITVLCNEPQGSVVAANTTGRFGPEEAQELLSWVRMKETHEKSDKGFQVDRLPHWFSGDESWPSGSPSRLAMLEYLNDRFPLWRKLPLV